MDTKEEENLRSVESKGDWGHLTEDILLEIFSYITFKELFIVPLVCRHWNHVSTDELLWKSKLSQNLFNGYMEQIGSTQSLTPKQIFLFFTQYERESHCSCRVNSNCSCGCIGFDSWQLEFSTKEEDNMFLVLRREIRDLMSYTRKTQPSVDIPTSQLSSYQIVRGGVDILKHWRMKPCPISPSFVFVEWIRWRSLHYTLTLEQNGIDPVDQNYTSLRKWTKIPVNNLKFKCANADSDWGIQVSISKNEFTIKYLVNISNHLRFNSQHFINNTSFFELTFGSSYEISLPNGQKFHVNCENSYLELEKLCESPKTLLSTIEMRLKSLIEHNGQETSRTQGCLPFQFSRQPRETISSIQDIDAHSYLKEKMIVLKDHHQQIHQHLLELLPKKIRDCFKP